MITLRGWFIDSECLICKHFNINTKIKDFQSVGNHISHVHPGWDTKSYVLHFFYLNKFPLCKCGCNQKVNWHNTEKKFYKYIVNHSKNPEIPQNPPEDFVPPKYTINETFLSKRRDLFPKEKCRFCDELISQNPHIYADHIEKQHSLISNTLKGIKCKQCNSFVANNGRELAVHINKKHKLQYENYEDYLVKHFFNNQLPRCACGCGEKTKYKKGKFKQYVGNHYNRRGKRKNV